MGFKYTVLALAAAINLVAGAASPTALAQRGSTVRGFAAQADEEGIDAFVPGAPEALRRLEDAGWLLRGSATFVQQFHPAFRSPYRGPASMQPAAQGRGTFSADLVLGRELWRGAEFIIVPQISRGFGLSNTLGVAAFPNAEAYRIGSDEPIGYFARAFFRQTIALSDDLVSQDDDPMRFTRSLPRERVTITAGKVSVYDFFDDNTYAHDARTQFLNWALMGAGAFDAAADARGYTNGVAVEWEDGTWATRVGAFQVSRLANGLALDPQPLKAWQALGEVDRFWTIGGRRGAVRLIGGLSSTRQQRWENRSAELDGPGANPAYWQHRLKTMAVVNAEQALTETLGVFGRVAWNDGRTENWMFTQIDRSASAGLSLKGGAWDRPYDTVGLAGHVGWLSAGQRRFLEAGGTGFIIGDGRLRYQPETVLETYYDARVGPGLNLTVDYQLVVNPAYNADRGPISVISLRARAAF